MTDTDLSVVGGGGQCLEATFGEQRKIFHLKVSQLPSACMVYLSMPNQSFDEDNELTSLDQTN